MMREQCSCGGAKPKVLVVSQYFSTHLGGLETVAAEISKRLAYSHGFSVEWVSSDCDAIPFPDDDQCLRCTPQRSWNGLESALGLPIPLWSIGAVVRLGRSVKRSDVVHVHDFIYPSSLAAMLYAFWYGKPVLTTQHIGWIPYKSPVLRAILWIANHVLGSVALRRSTRVVIYSTVVREYFSKIVKWKHAPLNISNGTDPQLHKPLLQSQRESIRSELGGTADRPVLLFVGRFVEKKGMPLLREIVAATPEVDWWVAGHGEMHPGNWNLQNVRVFDRPFGLSLSKLYQSADLLVLPSRGEGFPLVVQEAMACGTPVLISAETAAACPEASGVLLFEECSGVGDAERWVTRLRALMRRSEELLRLRQLVATYAEEHWSWNRTASEYAKVINELHEAAYR